MALNDIDTTTWGIASTLTTNITKILANFNIIKALVGDNGAVSVSQGGTGATTTAGAREALGAAGISQTITDGVTDKSPSENAVFDALAGKAPLVSPSFTGGTGDCTIAIASGTYATGGTTPAKLLFQNTQPAGWTGTHDVAMISTVGDVGDHRIGRMGFFVKQSYEATALTEVMRINQSGNVGIGTTSPQATLHSTGSTIVGVAGIGTFSSQGNQQLQFYLESGSLHLMVKDASGGERLIKLTLPASGGYREI